MFTLPPPAVISIPATAEAPDVSAWPDAFERDMDAVERELNARRMADEAEQDRRFIVFMEQDAKTCRYCAKETSAINIAGEPIPVCDRCLVLLVVAKVGRALVQQILA